MQNKQVPSRSIGSRSPWGSEVERKMASSSLDEKLADSVRKYPVLYDRSFAEFKNKLKKILVWKDVAKDEVMLGTYFYGL